MTSAPTATAAAPRLHAVRLAFPAGVAAVGLLAAAACLPGARSYAFWQDEVASARIVSEAHPAAMVRHVARTESTPPLWYALAWLVHRCGVAVADVRLLSVLAAVLLACATAVVARRLVPAPAALLSGLAVALGAQFDVHGRELRAYELAALLTVALAVAAERAAASQSRLDRVLLVGVVAAGSLTHYFFLFSVAAVVVWRRRLVREVALGLVPLAAWSPVAAAQFHRHRFSFIGRFDARAVGETYWRTFAAAEPHHVLLPLALLATVVAGAALLARRSDVGALWALLAVVPVALAAALWLAGLRIYDVRNLIGAGPFAAVAVSALVSRLPRLLGGVTACTLAALLLAGFVRASHRPPVDYRGIAAALVDEGWQPTDPIVVYGNANALWGPLEWYLPRRPTLVLHGGGTTAPPTFVVAGSGPHGRQVAATAVETHWVRRTLVARVEEPVRWRDGATFVVKP